MDDLTDVVRKIDYFFARVAALPNQGLSSRGPSAATPPA
jgi:hypothetical protein